MMKRFKVLQPHISKINDDDVCDLMPNIKESKKIDKRLWILRD